MAKFAPLDDVPTARFAPLDDAPSGKARFAPLDDAAPKKSFAESAIDTPMAILKGLGEGTTRTAAGINDVLMNVLGAAEKGASYLKTGKFGEAPITQTYTKEMVEKPRANLPAFALDKNAGLPEKVGKAAGQTLDVIKDVVLTGGEGTVIPAAASGMKALGKTLAGTAKQAWLPEVTEYAGTRRDVLEAGGTPTQAMIAGATKAALTPVSMALPIGVPGSRMKGALLGAGTSWPMSETSRQVMNAIQPSSLQAGPQSREDIIAGMAGGGMLGAIVRPPARETAMYRPPFKAEAGTEPFLAPGFEALLQGTEPVAPPVRENVRYTGLDKIAGKEKLKTGVEELKPPNISEIIKGLIRPEQPAPAPKPYTGMEGLLGKAEALGAGEISEPPKMPITPTVGKLIRGLPRKEKPAAPAQAAPESPQMELGFKPYDKTLEERFGPIENVSSETRRGGVEGGEQFGVSQNLRFLKPEAGPDTSPIDRLMFRAGKYAEGKHYESEEARQQAFEQLHTALGQSKEAKAQYPEFFNKNGSVSKEAVARVVGKYHTRVSTEMDNARRNYEGQDYVIHPSSYKDIRDRGGFDEGTPAPTAPTAPPKAGKPGEIAAPPEVVTTQSRAKKSADWLRSMASRAGWETVGGKLIRDPVTGEASSRTPWVPKEEWFEAGMGDEAAVTKAVEKAIAGKKLGAKEERVVKSMLDYIDEKNAPAEKTPDQKALEEYGPGTLGSNPFLDPKVIRQSFVWKLGGKANKALQSVTNAVQAAPDSALNAIGVAQDYARAIATSRLTAQENKVAKYLDTPYIAREFRKAMDEVKQIDPKYKQDAVTTPEEANAATERAQRHIAKIKFQDEMLSKGYAVIPGEGINLDGFRKVEGFDALTRGVKQMRLRNDLADAVEQMIAGHDAAAERRYQTKTIGGWIEGASHSLTSGIMLLPTFHLITTGGKYATGVIAAPKNSAARFLPAAFKAIGDKDVMKDLSLKGMQFFPKGHSMAVKGAEKGMVERAMSQTGITRKVYDGYQKMHNSVLANGVNAMQISYYLNRLEQLKSAHKGTLSPKALKTYENMAARDSNLIGGNLPKEEISRGWSRLLGSTLFSRGLQVSTIRMLTRSVEGDRLLESMAKRNGLTKEQAKDAVTNNQKFLARQMLKDLIILQAFTNGVNLAATALVDEPNGKKGAHLIWDNQGSDWKQAIIPTNMFVGVHDGKGMYMSTPFRTFRDIMEYAMMLPEIMTGQGAKILQNKESPLMHVGQIAASGKDWAGRPVQGATGVAASVAGQMMPAPFNQLADVAGEAVREGSGSYFAEGLKDVLRPSNAIPTLLGLQMRQPKEDPETNLKANEQTKIEDAMWANASAIKGQTRRFSDEEKQKAAKYVIDKAKETSPEIAGAIAKYMYGPEVSAGRYKKAAVYDAVQQQKEGGGIPTPPGMD